MKGSIYYQQLIMKIFLTLFKRFGLINHHGKQFLPGFLFFVILVLFPMVVKSKLAVETNNLRFDHYSTQQGLSNNKIHCILQDRKGWMWFGTSQGVCRFDGYRFTVFKHDSDDPTTLVGDLVRTIYEDHKGQIWIGTENGGLNKFNREKEFFEHFFFQNQLAVLNEVKVNSIQEDNEGNLLICSRTKLYKLGNENKLTEINPKNLLAIYMHYRFYSKSYTCSNNRIDRK